ncbi:MASE1 domain-containing protein [Sinorhizobium meliloti]|uniref:histidine kinase n=1 Tax=Sinorhizobium meliloti (strain SM11) TaxID=707241 RepID=F7XJU1_SINMM|nr:MASE1 domain-containing protein [Sinorhizobium meliloti]AEH83269.1 putative two-component sensor histidine kinase protein [Sinorhizobium meliloti SM11]ASP68676.1 ATPase [Sinorhizobium meliloti]MBP2468155.1 PAS domain S-box-containing protein [Sinorhizobium meliloti]MDE4561237.1 MASE1 domain-containing protein [Sinorhizobium meliloti SM11]MQW82167.1 PAS domain-containing protein [Sinorhizobium meliloti]
MMLIWPYRPHPRHLALFIVAYVLGCGFAHALAIVPGTGISFWAPSGLFIATLAIVQRQSWPWWLLAGCFAEVLSNFLWFHSPFPAAMLIYVGNALEAVIGASLVNWALKRSIRLETLREVLAFVVLGAGVAPVVSATVGSATLAWFRILSQTFTGAWPLWWIGDATGVLIVAPLAFIVIQNWRDKTELSAARLAEACVLGLIFLGVAALSLSGYLPFAYIIMPPLLWAAVRFEVKGAVVVLVLLTLITAIFTISGTSPFAGDDETQRHKQFMLQLFLAISAFSALIVAAISRQYQLALSNLQQSVATLRERERELSQIVNMVPVHIRRLTPEGEPTFFNKRLTDFFGLDLQQLEKPNASRLVTAVQTLVHPDDADSLLQAVRRSLATGEPYSIKYRMRRADGAYRWVDGRAEPLRDDSGTILQWFAISIDIDDEVRMQEALKQSERRYRELFHYMPIGLAQIDAGKLIPMFKEMRAQGVVSLETYIDENPEFLSHALEALEVEEVNQHVIDMFRANSREEMGGSITRYWQPALATIRRSIEARYRGEEVFQEETRVARMDGSVMDVVFATAQPGAIADKSLVGFIDITERKRAEEALRAREREFSQLVNMVPSYLWRLTPDGVPNFLNQRLIDFLGPDVVNANVEGVHPLAAIIGAVVHPDDKTRMSNALFHSVATGERFSMKYRLRRADGVYRWVEGSAEPMRDEEGRILQWYGLSHDIDDIMHVEEALRNSKQQLEQMIEAVPFSTLSFAPTGELTYVSKRYQDQAGAPGAEIKDFDALAREVAHPDDFPTMFARATQGFATGQPFVNRFRRRLKDGNYRWIEARAQPLRRADGPIVQWYFASIDIEEEMRAQEALRERERFLWQLVETLPAMIDCAAPNGEPVYRSQQLRDFLGYELEELDGGAKSRLDATLDAGVHPDDLAGVKEQYARSLESGEPYRRKHRLRRFDGEYRWIETRAAPMRDEKGAIVQWNVICLDVDREVRMQEELRLAQDRLARAGQAASLAELSASIAHEVNQPLAAIVANSHACYRWLSADPVNIERAKITTERVIRDAKSAADVVSRIRALFKQSVENRGILVLSDVISEACSLVAAEALRRRIRLNIDVETNLAPVTVDRIQVQQVLVNLIRNGMEAMDAVDDNKTVDVRMHQVDDEVRIEIGDNGNGVAFPERIFEPFFTTKENGMGMGLAISRSIVEAHGGRLWAEKNEPRGARFVFTLPNVAKGAT